MRKEIAMMPSDRAEAERRFSELAGSNARLELLNRLLVSLSSVQVVDDTVQHILEILTEALGAANVSIVYAVNGTHKLRDIHGVSRDFETEEDPELASVLAHGKAVRSSWTEGSGPAPEADAAHPAQRWIFPLLSRGRCTGAVSIDLSPADPNLFEELQPFFVYAAVMLDRELPNPSHPCEAHARLQQSETLYRSLFEQSPDGIVIWSFPDSKPLQFNEAAHLQLGYTREEFAVLSVQDLRPGDPQAEMERHTATLMRQGTVSFEALHRTKSGQCSWMFIALKLFEVDGRRLCLAIHRDINELKESAKTLELYRHALDNSRDMIFLADRDARYRFANQAACECSGYTRAELLSKGVFDLAADFTPDMWPAHWEEVKKKGTLRFEGHLVSRDGVLIPVEAGLSLFNFEDAEYIVAAVRDLTERRRMEEERRRLEQQLLHAQKLESLGALAGGIAHEFNNILMAIVGNADLALMRIGKESTAANNIRQIEKAAMRAADLSKQMLAYSGKGNFEAETVNLNLMLQEMLHILQLSVPKKITLRLQPSLVLPTVEVDPAQIRQIVMNLVVNASEAIGDGSGLIVIKTGFMECDRSYLDDVWTGKDVKEGLYAYVEIADNGCGMSKEILSRIFDPFFTTKFTGRGLGMAAVLGIIRGHHGTLKVFSEPGRGTTIRILFPAGSIPAEAQACADSEARGAGRSKVLLVDDEETVRDVAVAMLGELGHDLVTARNGREAIAIFQSDPDINFVILDLTMPQMDGEECFRQLRQINPEVTVIMSSGYNQQEVSQLFAGKGVAGFIQKPYTLSVLKEVLKDAVAK